MIVTYNGVGIISDMHCNPHEMYKRTQIVYLLLCISEKYNRSPSKSRQNPKTKGWKLSIKSSRLLVQQSKDIKFKMIPTEKQQILSHLRRST